MTRSGNIPQTRFEVMHRRKPDVIHLRPIGCKAFVYKLKEEIKGKPSLVQSEGRFWVSAKEVHTECYFKEVTR